MLAMVIVDRRIRIQALVFFLITTTDKRVPRRSLQFSVLSVFSVVQNAVALPKPRDALAWPFQHRNDGFFTAENAEGAEDRRSCSPLLHSIRE